MQQDAEPIVTRLGELDPRAVQSFFSARGLELVPLPEHAEIPGSYWGAPEAGLIGNRLYVRADTPVHSALHEACHYLCMDQPRRNGLHTDAGGTDTEENAVCYLQALLAEHLPGYTRAQLFADMDAWGYHFILGSAQAWFERDAEDARAWLRRADLIDAGGGLNYQ
jgi:hypothetical protein